jgi:hypothetical protein
VKTLNYALWHRAIDARFAEQVKSAQVYQSIYLGRITDIAVTLQFTWWDSDLSISALEDCGGTADAMETLLNIWRNRFHEELNTLELGPLAHAIREALDEGN